ncbi:MAG: hypothetical protein HY290_16910 [Planctomycetia bacterium]|nr:hypothetical protein [Planctomycetia bacterium]
MPPLDWQLIVVAVALAAAAAYVARRGIGAWRSARKSSGGACSSCKSCGPAARPTGQPANFVPVDVLQSPEPGPK